MSRILGRPVFFYAIENRKFLREAEVQGGERMIRVKVEDKKESLFFAIALGSVLLMAIGTTAVYWTQHDAQDVSKVQGGLQATASEQPGGDQGVVGKYEDDTAGTQTVSSVKPYSEMENENDSLLYFLTLMCALLVLFGLTFRYYSHREMKEAEKRWETATRNFVIRMETERANSGDVRFDQDTIWSRILKGEGVGAAQIDRIPVGDSRKT